ncbi:MAG: T9SS type A sorting domain-containing protein [Fluviicola sp.]
MKKNVLTLSFLVVAVFVNAQTEDSITQQVGRTHESYYSFSNGEVANVDNMDWDIAFELDGLGSSVRSNGHTATEVYVYPGTDWNSVDTTGMNWEVQYNSETTWETGAFDQDADPQDPFDVGWGEYSMITHSVTGNRIFIVKLATGDYKKVMIESLANGVFSFKHADLNGSGEIAQTIDKNAYASKNFVYYSITNELVIDREPANDMWDIVFTKYMASLAPGVTYLVTGVQSNKGVHVRQADGVDPSMADYNNFAVDSVIDVIGHDWKEFSMGTYTIPSDLSYFVEDLNGDLWHLIFTRFDLSSSGKTVFSKERVANASIEEFEDITSFGVHPNPAEEYVTVVFNSNKTTRLSIKDMNGSVRSQESIPFTGFNTKTLSVTDFPAGVYFVHLTTENGKLTQKLIVQ